jgi:hypothetical protein
MPQQLEYGDHPCETISILFISYYMWTCARISIRFIFFKILSLDLIIAKMTLSDFLPLKAFRDLLI